MSTHALDAATGRPASGLRVVLEAREPAGGWRRLADAVTGDDGRVADLLPESGTAGVHRIIFETGEWAAEHRVPTFYPRVTVEFHVVDPDSHHHVPLLLSPYGYTTYRGG